MANCTPSAILAAATCFDCGPTHKQHIAMQTYLLAQIAIANGVIATATPASLMQAATCFDCALSEKEMLAIQVYLLCLINFPNG